MIGFFFGLPSARFVEQTLQTTARRRRVLRGFASLPAVSFAARPSPSARMSPHKANALKRKAQRSARARSSNGVGTASLPKSASPSPHRLPLRLIPPQIPPLLPHGSPPPASQSRRPYGVSVGGKAPRAAALWLAATVPTSRKQPAGERFAAATRLKPPPQVAGADSLCGAERARNLKAVIICAG